jgi:hypothetical protein
MILSGLISSNKQLVQPYLNNNPLTTANKEM